MEDPVPEFGEPIRKEFMFKEGGVYLNHGSYGAMPRCVHERQIQYLAELETSPDIWFRKSMKKYVTSAVKKVSEFLGTDPKDTFLLQNATKAVNTVLKTFPMQPGDSVMITNLTYPAVKKTTWHTTERRKGTNTRYLEIKIPIRSEDELIEMYDQFLNENKDIRLAIIDHITSPTAIKMPVKRLTELCHRRGIIVLIDGAHAPGLLDIDIYGIDADFYAGNFHKWVYSPRACAFLWRNPQRLNPWLTPLITSKLDGAGLSLEFIHEGNLHKWVYSPRACAFLWRNPKRQHDWLKPLVTSTLDGDGLVDEFTYEGTKDDTPYICTMAGIDYYNRLGGKGKILSYTTNLQKQGIAYLEKQWGTKRMDVPESFVSPNQQMIELPHIPYYSDDPGRAEELLYFLLEKYSITCLPFHIQGTLMCRVMVNVYNTMDDFKKLADVILSLTEKQDDAHET